jgi:excisionase family DNA binding protein
VRRGGAPGDALGGVPLPPRAALAALLTTLDDLATADLPDVLGLLEAAKARCWARLTAPPPPTRSDDPTQMLTVREAAARLGLSPDYLYRHKEQLPFMQKVGTRTIRCPATALARWQASRRSCV